MRRTTPRQLDNLVFSVWQGSRIKEARGQQRHHFNSTLDMIIHHEFFDAVDFVMDEEECWIHLFGEDGDEILFIRYDIEEVQDYDERIVQDR